MDKLGPLSTPAGFKMDCEDHYFPAKYVADDDSGSSRTSIKEHRTFLTEGLNEFYVPIDKYEGRHRYDPNFRWEEQEERKLVRKVRRDAGS
jgi:HD superfamily phosphodiesterase